MEKVSISRLNDTGKTSTPQLFQAFAFDNGLTLRNRVVMAPMTTWSATADGNISEAELDYYQRRAAGVGMVITGCTHVTENGIGFSNEFAAYDDRFTPGLRRLAQAAQSGGALAVLQIFMRATKRWWMPFPRVNWSALAR